MAQIETESAQSPAQGALFTANPIACSGNGSCFEKKKALGPILPVLRSLVDSAVHAGFRIPADVKLVAVQHVLRTNISLFEALFDLGLQPANTFVIGKGYSTSPSCLRALQMLGARIVADLPPPRYGHYDAARESELREFWMGADGPGMLRGGEKIILADVGGRLLSLGGDYASRCDPAMAGVELTTSGVHRLERRPCRFPVVNVAQSAAKSLHESPLVAETILDRLDRRSPAWWVNAKIGVIGLGEIGIAMSRLLMKRGFDVITSDPASSRKLGGVAKPVPLSELLREANVIFGCTGTDVFESTPLSIHQPTLILVSCSSEDVEFRSILRTVNRSAPAHWPVGDLRISSEYGPLTVIAGGYPLNFDTSGVSVDEDAIQVTTALMLAGIMAASSILCDSTSPVDPKYYQVSSDLQSAILEKWRRSVGTPSRCECAPTEWGQAYLRVRSGGELLRDRDVFYRIAEQMLRS